MVIGKQVLRPLLLLLPLSCILACRPHEVYSNEDAGWTVEYPAAYTRMTPQEVASIEAKGRSAVAAELDEAPYARLLFLKKGAGSGLSSTLTPYSGTEESFADNRLQMIQMITETYNRYGIPAQVDTERMLLDGIAFHAVHVTLLARDSKSIVSRQIILERLIEKTSILTITLYFKADESRQELLSIVNSSKFSKRN